MVTVTNRAQRIEESAQKIESPFVLDPSLCLYSPQDNVDSLTHPRIAAWLDFVRNEYVPDLPKAKRRVLLFMPCTKTKPYPFSSEHKAINQRLADSGFKPIARLDLPQELMARLEPEFSQDVLNLAPLMNDAGTLIHRMVISEPMSVVPYEHIVAYNGLPSPATAYDDPGLFEKRGNAVSPWRDNSTATAISATRWRWGEEEKRHYVLMHNEMAKAVADVVARIRPHYDDVIAWVAPGLTHRSFVIGKGERAANNVASSRLVGAERIPLLGANDFLPKAEAIRALPTLDDCKDAIGRLANRLGIDTVQATGIYARGGANATPLALPELLDVLIAQISTPRKK
ncbi:hypothetical protein C3941_18125 [Kaistia algarum]|uniref:hypothetical protein n=1 Tax=Kaistia algarum TaxID=2083279 RepID=UPI000CE8EBFD|nr:hypothetical protein [Kaistia algarum]MCX5515469.1 hypothetical protein [Kaistia algarum]PPE78474.1 hypothetical protein C3941_18125 [Kaistia algarum]